jgi:aldose 1-epimerase
MTQITPFGYTKNGDLVEAISIGSSALSAKILTLGGIINDVRLDSVNWPLTLGSSEVAAYEGKLNSFGSLMGPVVNRIKGCSAKIDGVRYEFEKHHSGNLTQHSGNTGMQKQLWTIAKYGPEFVTFEQNDH